MKHNYILCAAATAAAVLCVKEVLDRKRDKEKQNYINWLHARCDKYDEALEILLDGESGAF